MNSPLIWVLTDDRAGNVAQALGVAEALNRSYQTKEIRYTPLAWLPNVIQGAMLIGVTPETRQALTPPWPDLVISAGRRTAPVARWIKRRHPGVILSHLMDPGRAGAADFDLIAIPEHDRARPGGDAPNVLRTLGAPHRVTPERLAGAKAAWLPRLGALPRPLIALAVGGATRQRPFPTETAIALGRAVRTMAGGGSVLFTTSRRTGAGAEQALLDAIPEPCFSYLWGQGEENPYTAFLAVADAIVVTGDSVSMCSEACAGQGPVYIFAPEGMVSAKHARLHRRLFERGMARPFEGRWEDWIHPALNAARDVARAIDEKLKAR